MALIRVHEGDPCKWCGARRPGPESTCIFRIAAASGDAPARRVPACEDAEIISARLAELAADRQAWLSRPAEVPAPAKAGGGDGTA